jgi:hypothetical protein
MVSISRCGNNLLSIVYKDDKIVGCASYYCKNLNTQQSTCSLYNIFSLSPGAGSAAFNMYWQYTHTTSKWFKFYVFKKAANFYSKFNVKYFGVSKTGQTFIGFGRVYSTNVIQSMNNWHNTYSKLDSGDTQYFNKNFKVFQEKHNIGKLKLREPYISILQKNMLIYNIDIPTLTEFEE